MTEYTVYRKVNVKDRLPEKEDCFFVFTEGVEKYANAFGDEEITNFTHCGYHRFVNTFQGKYFSSLSENETVTHWLEPITLTLPDDGEINQFTHDNCNEPADRYGFAKGAKFFKNLISNQLK